MSAKVITAPAKVRASKPNQGSGSVRFGDLTITKPNGEIIVIKQEPRKVANRNKRNKKRASRKVRDKVRKVSEQDTKWIELQERREKLMREMGSIHAE
jgi:hypothetical protein